MYILAPLKSRTALWPIAICVITIVSTAFIVYFGAGDTAVPLKAAEPADIPFLPSTETSPTTDPIFNFLYGRDTSLFPFLNFIKKEKYRAQCGGMNLDQIRQDRNFQSFWTLDTINNSFVIRPQNVDLLPCEPLSHAKFAIALMNSPNEPDFYFPLDYAIPNKTIPGVYHVRVNLKPLECIPAQKYLVSVKLEYAFMHDTPKDKMEFFGHLDVEPSEQYISYVNESAATFPCSELATIDTSSFQCLNSATISKVCNAKQLQSLRVYRDTSGLHSTECTIPQFWYPDLLKTPQKTLCGGKCQADQWIHIIGDSNSNYLFNQLVSEKLGIQECYRDFGFPANSVCFRDSFGRKKRKTDITIFVYTHWYMDPDNLQPWNAFDGLTLPQLLEKEEFKKILPRLEDDHQQIDFQSRWKGMGLPARTIVSLGSHYDHQTPNAMNITMTDILDRIMAQKDRSHYKETAIFVTETPVLTSEFPPQYGTLLHQNNARIMERNRMIIHNCRKRGFKCLDIYGFAKAQNEWMEPGDGLHFKSGQEGHVYNRVSDTLFMEMGYRV